MQRCQRHVVPLTMAALVLAAQVIRLLHAVPAQGYADQFSGFGDCVVVDDTPAGIGLVGRHALTRECDGFWDGQRRRLPAVRQDNQGIPLGHTLARLVRGANGYLDHLVVGLSE